MNTCYEGIYVVGSVGGGTWENFPMAGIINVQVGKVLTHLLNAAGIKAGRLRY